MAGLGITYTTVHKTNDQNVRILAPINYSAPDQGNYRPINDIIITGRRKTIDEFTVKWAGDMQSCMAPRNSIYLSVQSGAVSYINEHKLEEIKAGMRNEEAKEVPNADVDVPIRNVEVPAPSLPVPPQVR